VQTDDLLATAVRHHPDGETISIYTFLREVPVSRPGDVVPSTTVGKSTDAIISTGGLVVAESTEVVAKSVLTKTTFLGRAKTAFKRDFVRTYNALKILNKRVRIPAAKLTYRLVKMLQKLLNKITNSLRRNLSKLLRKLKRRFKPRKRGGKDDDDDWFSIGGVKRLIRYMIKSKLLTLAGKLFSSMTAKIFAFFGLIGSALGLIKNMYDAYTRLNEYEKRLEQELEDEAVDDDDIGDTENTGDNSENRVVETASNTTTENDDSTAGPGAGGTGATKFNPCKCRWRC
jgi:hypothetical protein